MLATAISPPPFSRTQVDLNCARGSYHQGLSANCASSATLRLLQSLAKCQELDQGFVTLHLKVRRVPNHAPKLIPLQFYLRNAGPRTVRVVVVGGGGGRAVCQNIDYGVQWYILAS